MIIAKHIGPLYCNDPVILFNIKLRLQLSCSCCFLQREIQETLHNLLNTIVLINSCSEFYSKPDKITSLLVLVKTIN